MGIYFLTKKSYKLKNNKFENNFYELTYLIMFNYLNRAMIKINIPTNNIIKLINIL